LHVPVTQYEIGTGSEEDTQYCTYFALILLMSPAGIGGTPARENIERYMYASKLHINTDQFALEHQPQLALSMVWCGPWTYCD